jgi:hypothetical protein
VYKDEDVEVDEKGIGLLTCFFVLYVCSLFILNRETWIIPFWVIQNVLSAKSKI